MNSVAHARIRLGHIVYSNCFPVHGRLIDSPAEGDPDLIPGVPSQLNAMLQRGDIDVAPCSSIEYARHPRRYRILQDLVIGARGPVRSILLLSDHHPRELDGRVLALPSASATSVVLLKILLKTRWGSEPNFFWFDQATEDPFARGAAAALFIGDVALRPGLHPHLSVRLDLGSEWMAETGLPFAFAVWQAREGSGGDLERLRSILLQSRTYCAENRHDLAARHAVEFGLPPELLESYWADLQYELDGPMIEGLRAYYRLAAEIGELERPPELRWVG